ncbi:unnamed protein product, partial [Heterosigma akashiwo]
GRPDGHRHAGRQLGDPGAEGAARGHARGHRQLLRGHLPRTEWTRTRALRGFPAAPSATTGALPTTQA